MPKASNERRVLVAGRDKKRGLLNAEYALISGCCTSLFHATPGTQKNPFGLSGRKGQGRQDQDRNNQDNEVEYFKFVEAFGANRQSSHAEPPLLAISPRCCSPGENYLAFFLAAGPDISTPGGEV